MQNVLNTLDQIGISYELYTHPAAYTCEEAKQHTGHLPCIHSKNLFLRNKDKIQYYLLTQGTFGIR